MMNSCSILRAILGTFYTLCGSVLGLSKIIKRCPLKERITKSFPFFLGDSDPCQEDPWLDFSP